MGVAVGVRGGVNRVAVGCLTHVHFGHWACCTTLATAVAAKIAVATVAERRQVGRDSLHCTTR